MPKFLAEVRRHLFFRRRHEHDRQRVPCRVEVQLQHHAGNEREIPVPLTQIVLHQFHNDLLLAVQQPPWVHEVELDLELVRLHRPLRGGVDIVSPACCRSSLHDGVVLPLAADAFLHGHVVRFQPLQAATGHGPLVVLGQLRKRDLLADAPNLVQEVGVLFGEPQRGVQRLRSGVELTKTNLGKPEAGKQLALREAKLRRARPGSAVASCTPASRDRLHLFLAQHL
mmetsp:Transcript_5711/g.14239  ORF Transcript_5711/g.14239 Transcript_5711/m.14239 type:complete len:226 (+) Transcript_5711:235-912(+)